MSAATPTTRTSLDHMSNVFKRLNAQRSQNEMCDFVIKAGEKSFTTQRNFLSACSDYFKAMLSHDTKEAQEGVLEMVDVDPTAVEQCINFMYTGKASFTLEKSLSLVHAAQLMQLDGLTKMYYEYLGENMDSKNCLYIKGLADLYNSAELAEVADAFIAEHTEEVIASDDFKDLEEPAVHQCLKKYAERKGFDERILWKAMMGWIKRDPENRKTALTGFVKITPFEHFSTKFIMENVKIEPMVRESVECTGILLDILCKLQTTNEAEKSSEKKEKFCQVSLQVATEDAEEETENVEGLTPYVAVFLSEYGIVTGLNTETNEWCRLFRVLGTSKEDKIFSVSNKLYILCTDGVMHFSKNGKVLHKSVCDITIPTDAKEVVFKNRLYLITDSRMLCYNPLKTEWILDLKGCGLEAGFCVAATDEHMYAIGGGDKGSKSAVEYNFLENIWQKITDMPRERTSAAAVGIGKNVYVFGGQYKVYRSTGYGRYRGNYWETVAAEMFLCYDYSRNIWTDLPIAPHRHLSGAAVSTCSVGNKIYVLSCVISVCTTDVYDIDKRQWTTLESISWNGQKYSACIIFK